MDIGAYALMDTLEKIAKANGIEVNRTRGYRLMVNEIPITEERVARSIESIFQFEAKSKIEEKRINGLGTCYRPLWFDDQDPIVKRKCKKYFKVGATGSYVLKWKNVHGKLRKEIKFIRKNVIKRVKIQSYVFNKYAGRYDVLYIHARQGSINWSDTTWKNYINEPWFLDAVEDAFDPTYCDIYAKIDPETLKLLDEKQDKEDEFDFGNEDSDISEANREHIMDLIGKEINDLQKAYLNKKFKGDWDPYGRV